MQDIDQDRFQMMWRRADLQDELLASEAWQLERRLKQFDLSLEVFHRNYRELDGAIAAHLPQAERPESIARFSQDHAGREEEQVEITRLFHNFVSSALTLIDNTRVFYRDEYEKKGLMKDYQTTMEQFFSRHGPSHVVKGLRQFTQHVQLPLISSSLRMSIDPPTFEAKVQLKREALLRHKNCWSSVAKEWLEQQDEKLDVRSLIAEYHTQVTDFYKWFAGRQREIHAEEMAYLTRVRDEMRRLGRELKEPIVPASGGGQSVEAEHVDPYPKAQIELLAYYIYLDEGQKHGRDKIHWQTAIQRLRELENRATTEPT
jgi:hypothetical protein